jgi:hypothetical protein
VVRGGSPGDLEAVLEERALQKLCQDTERIQNTPMYVCAKTAFVGLPSTKSGRVSSFRNFSSYNKYFGKQFKLVYIKYVVMVNLTTGIIFRPFTCMHFWVWGILRRWPACAPTAYEVVRDCRKFEKN